MPALTAKVRLQSSLAVVALVKMNAETGEFRDPLGAFSNDGANNILATKSGAGSECVADVKVEGILVAHHASHSALRPRGVRVGRGAFGNQGDGAFLRGLQSERQARDTAAEDDKIKLSHGIAGRAMLSIRRALPRKTATASRPTARRLRRVCNVVASTAST